MVKKERQIHDNPFTLALIIPAYKADFLSQTLLSLTRQTDKRFNVYIGDDCSPNDLYSIIAPFFSKLNIRYHRFNDNLGSVSLTRQWERCINLSEEDWIWLFSDDDLLSENAVEAFYQKVNSNDLLYKFNTKIIDKNNHFLPSKFQYEKHNRLQGELTSERYITQRLESKGFRSYAVEYVFHRSLYRSNGFIDFPLAWSSDDATWLLYSLENSRKICLIDSYVYWRSSGKNISSNNKSIENVAKKIDASRLYIMWLSKIDKQYNLQIPVNLKLKWITRQISSLNISISWVNFKSLINNLHMSFPFFTIFRYYIIYIKRKQLEKILK